MYFFGHEGITTGIVKACQELITAGKPGNSASHLSPQSGAAPGAKHVILGGIRGTMRSIDYRFVLVGALWPDIIDKPVWVLTNSNWHMAGRSYAHTLLFNLVLLIAGLILVTRRSKPWLLTISLCSFTHLVFDRMWLNPTILLWPLLGPIGQGAAPAWSGPAELGLSLARADL